MLTRIYSLDELGDSPEMTDAPAPWWIHFLSFLVILLLLVGGGLAAQRIQRLYVKAGSDHSAQVETR